MLYDIVEWQKMYGCEGDGVQLSNNNHGPAFNGLIRSRLNFLDNFLLPSAAPLLCQILLVFYYSAVRFYGNLWLQEAVFKKNIEGLVEHHFTISNHTPIFLLEFFNVNYFLFRIVVVTALSNCALHVNCCCDSIYDFIIPFCLFSLS